MTLFFADMSVQSDIHLLVLVRFGPCTYILEHSATIVVLVVRAIFSSSGDEERAMLRRRFSRYKHTYEHSSEQI